MVILPKNDGSLRFFVDYQNLNAVTVRGSAPFLVVDEHDDSLGEVRIFSAWNSQSGYW